MAAKIVHRGGYTVYSAFKRDARDSGYNNLELEALWRLLSFNQHEVKRRPMSLMVETGMLELTDAHKGRGCTKPAIKKTFKPYKVRRALSQTFSFSQIPTQIRSMNCGVG